MDPFIKVQIISTNVLNNLVIKKDPRKSNEYVVSYSYSSSPVIEIHLTMVNGKIDSVW